MRRQAQHKIMERQLQWCLTKKSYYPSFSASGDKLNISIMERLIHSILYCNNQISLGGGGVGGSMPSTYAPILGPYIVAEWYCVG